jgi:hypothetical protein
MWHAFPRLEYDAVGEIVGLEAVKGLVGKGEYILIDGYRTFSNGSV